MTKSEINKAMQNDKWESLELEYSGEIEKDYTLDRVTFGITKMTQIAKYRKRGLIDSVEYNNVRKAIERFMF